MLGLLEANWQQIFQIYQMSIADTPVQVSKTRRTTQHKPGDL